jgi:hypothetical protein
VQWRYQRGGINNRELAIFKEEAVQVHVVLQYKV